MGGGEVEGQGGRGGEGACGHPCLECQGRELRLPQEAAGTGRFRKRAPRVPCAVQATRSEMGVRPKRCCGHSLTREAEAAAGGGWEVDSQVSDPHTGSEVRGPESCCPAQGEGTGLTRCHPRCVCRNMRTPPSPASLTSSPDRGADAAVPRTPTALLWPRLPAPTLHLGPGLGLGVALRAQREERVRLPRQTSSRLKDSRPGKTAASWADWPWHWGARQGHRD